MPWNTLFFNLSTLLSIALWLIDFSWFLQISLGVLRSSVNNTMIEIDYINTHVSLNILIIDFDRLFKLINWLLSSNIDLSISFSIIDL